MLSSAALQMCMVLNQPCSTNTSVLPSSAAVLPKWAVKLQNLPEAPAPVAGFRPACQRAHCTSIHSQQSSTGALHAALVKRYAVATAGRACTGCCRQHSGCMDSAAGHRSPATWQPQHPRGSDLQPVQVHFLTVVPYPDGHTSMTRQKHCITSLACILCRASLRLQHQRPWQSSSCTSTCAVPKLTSHGNTRCCHRAVARLQAQQITVEAGGQLAAGSLSAPHPGRINISFSGASDQVQPEQSLLVYGNLSLHGLPRPPAWTVLAAAALKGATGERSLPRSHACIACLLCSCSACLGWR